MNLKIRLAELSDLKDISQLIHKSVHVLCKDIYSEKQISEALKQAWGTDTQLIHDKTYYVVEEQSKIVGCGGWSYRKTLFGNNEEENRNPQIISAETGAAKIRAFFVDPDYARKGIASSIMKKCEEEALKKGYSKLELMATLPGKKLYNKHGFIAHIPIEYRLYKDLTITFIPMTKKLSNLLSN